MKTSLFNDGPINYYTHNQVETSSHPLRNELSEIYVHNDALSTASWRRQMIF